MTVEKLLHLAEAKIAYYDALKAITNVLAPRDSVNANPLFERPEWMDNDKDKGDTTMKFETDNFIKEEADAIAHKVVRNAVHKIVKMSKDDISSFEDVMAYASAATDTLQRSTFDVHIIVQPRKDGMHIETSIRGSVSDVQRDDDEE